MAEDQVREIKSKIDIVDLVSGYVPLKKAGKNFKALCPFHNEKTPSFMVSPELQIFKCFGCSRGGDIYAFLQEIEGIDFGEALRILAEKTGVKLESRRPSPEEEKRQEILKVNSLAKEYFSYLLNEHRVGERAGQYLKDRGINRETVKTFGLGYAPDSWESLSKFLVSRGFLTLTLLASGLVKLGERKKTPYDFFRGRITFPFFGHGGQVIGFAGRTLGADEPKYLNVGETLLFKKGSFLYGLEQAKTAIKRQNSAIVVEGPFDVISAFQAGTKNVVGSQGTALTPDQIRLLKRYTQNISLCFDTDLSGDAAARRGINLAEERGLNVKVITLPHEYKDPDEIAQKNPALWQEVAGAAVSVYDFLFFSTFKRHNVAESLGKKQIANELLPIIKAIPNEIEREHYIKRLALELEVDEGVVRSMMEKTESREEREARRDEGEGGAVKEERLGLEEYLLALILHAPADLAQKTLHKLGKGDFEDAVSLNLFEGLKTYLSHRKRRLDIKVFGGKLADKERALLGRVYLWDLGELALRDTKLEEEISQAVKLLKKRSLKRELGNLSRKIKEAELMGEKEALGSARQAFTRVSQQLSKISKNDEKK